MLKKKIRPAFIGFIILFGFSYYGLHVAQDANDATKKAVATYNVSTVTTNLQICDAINQGRKAAQQAIQRTATSQVAQVEKLQDRFKQANELNPPTTPGAAASQAAGAKFFEQFVEDTKAETDLAVSDLKKETPIVNCSAIPNAQQRG